jgi:hypothetical protein
LLHLWAFFRRSASFLRQPPALHSLSNRSPLAPYTQPPPAFVFLRIYKYYICYALCTALRVCNRI